MKKTDIIEGESFNSQKDKKEKKSNRNLLVGLFLVILLFVGVISTKTLLKSQQSSQQYADTLNLNACGQPGGFCETFDGAPTAPLPLGGIAAKYILPNWTFSVHSRDQATWHNLETQDNVMHGADCGAPPATHTNNTYEGAVFNCKNHVMTAMLAGGYGLISMTPNAMVDFSGGPAIVQWEMSTDRMSTRDWPDVWITPWTDATILPYDAGAVDMQGPAANAVHVDAGANQNSWGGGIIQNGTETGFNTQWWTSMNEGIAAGTNQDAVRQTFRITLSSNHIRMERLPSATAPVGITWFDQDIPTLNFTQGVVQFSHHIYNPFKDNAGVSATWHWDTVAINPSVPFSVVHPDKRFVEVSDPAVNNNQQVVFDAPAPANSLLKFAGIGKVEYSYNNGATWTEAPKQLFTGPFEHFAPYSIPIPEGTQKVNFKFSADNWYGCNYGCMAEDFVIWSTTLPAGSPAIPTPTTIPGQPTSTPAPTDTPTPTPTATPIPTATPRPTATPTPKPTNTPAPTSTVPTATPTIASNSTWVGQYYQYSKYSTSKGLNGTPVLVRTDSAINFNWGALSPASNIRNDRFSARWTSHPYINAGTYQFKTVSDDGVRVYLDGQLLTGVSLWTDHSSTTRTQNVTVSAGVHTIVVEYYENGGLANVSFSY